MKQIQTPMNKLKQHFANFKENVIGYCPTGKALELTCSDELYNHYGSEFYRGRETAIRKEIKSDFIRIYNFDKANSIAFKFTYLGEDKSTVLEDQYMEIILKLDHKYYNSYVYTIEASKEVMRFINKSVKDMKPLDMILFLRENVIPSANEAKQTTEDFSNTLDYEVAETEHVLGSHIQGFHNLNRAIDRNIKKIREYEWSMPEVQELTKIRQRAHELERIIALNKRKRSKELKIDENKTERDELNSKIDECKNHVKTVGLRINEQFKIPLDLVTNMITERLSKFK